VNIVLKACPCLLRRQGGRLQALAFVHPCGDRQVVKGTVEPGEDVEAAAIRELVEEAGITGARVVRLLGIIERRVGAGPTEDGPEERHMWHVFLCRADGPLPDSWRQLAQGSDVERDLVFSFFWQDLPGDYRTYHPVFRQVLALLEHEIGSPDVPDEVAVVPAREPDCVVVLPVLDDGSVVLLREARRRWRGTDAERGWGCPAGHVEDGESAVAAATREALEEAGVSLADVTVLGRPFYPSGKDGRLHHVVTGRAARVAEGGGDEYEEILEVRAFTVDEVRGLVRRGDVLHGPSLVALGRWFDEEVGRW